jgi:hypothetical protein
MYGEDNAVIEASRISLTLELYSRKRRPAAADQSGVEPPHSKKKTRGQNDRLAAGSLKRFVRLRYFSSRSSLKATPATRVLTHQYQEVNVIAALL